MKLLVVTLNVLWFGAGVMFVVTEGIPRPTNEDFYIMLLMIVTPLVTLLYFLFPRDGWIDLWLKRKAAEERKKLKELEPE